MTSLLLVVAITVVVVVYESFLMGIWKSVRIHHWCVWCVTLVSKLPIFFDIPMVSLWPLTISVKGYKSIIFTVHLTSCVFLFITFFCSFPDVRMDTSAHDAYRLSRSGCTCPVLSKVCSLDMSSWEQRHSCHWITSVDSCCPPSFLPLSPPLSPSQVNTQWAVHYTMYTVVSSMGTLCFCCL